MIEVSAISRSFRDIQAVSDVSFSVSKGEIFGIVGPDGAGKSTLLRMAASILYPDKGEILLEGESIFTNTYLSKERMAYMPQRFGLYEDLTVEENIFFFGRLFGVRKKEIKKRLPRLYSFSNLEPFKGRLAGKLSGGMKQKLGLACCLVHTPDLILLDEPTNGVDPVSRREFWKILYDLLSEGVSIIVSTAYLDEAERCNRIALMYKGSFIRTGKPKDVRKDTGKKCLEIVSAESRKAEAVLNKNSTLGIIIRTGKSIKLFTDNNKKTKDLIIKIFRKHSLQYESMKEIIPSLEDSFIHIVSNEETIWD